METQPNTPRVYIADLAAYNSGILHGEWTDATDADEIRETIARVLRNSPCPNVMIDCPNLWGGGPGPAHTNNPAPGVGCAICHCRGDFKVPSAEEYAIHDYDGFGEITSMLGEYPDLEKLAEHARMIEEHDGAWLAYVANVHIDYASEGDFQERYQGEWDSAADYVAEMHEGREIPDWLASYVDWDSMAHDWEQGGNITVIRTGHGTVYIFGEG